MRFVFEFLNISVINSSRVDERTVTHINTYALCEYCEFIEEAIGEKMREEKLGFVKTLQIRKKGREKEVKNVSCLCFYPLNHVVDI